MLGFTNDTVDVEIADPDPIKISLMIKRIFFLFKDLYFSLKDSLSLLRLFNIFSNHVSLFCIEVLLIDQPLFLFLIIQHHRFSHSDKSIIR